MGLSRRNGGQCRIVRYGHGTLCQHWQHGGGPLRPHCDVIEYWQSPDRWRWRRVSNRRAGCRYCGTLHSRNIDSSAHPVLSFGRWSRARGHLECGNGPDRLTRKPRRRRRDSIAVHGEPGARWFNSVQNCDWWTPCRDPIFRRCSRVPRVFSSQFSRARGSDFRLRGFGATHLSRAVE